MGWSHFPGYKPRVSGTIIAGFGFGASIFNLVATSLVNPSNKSTDIKVKDGGVTDHFFSYDVASQVPSMLRWLALIYLIVSIVGILLLRNVKSRDNEETTEQTAMKPHLKSKLFWRLVLSSLLSAAGGMYIAGTYKNFGDTRIENDAFLAVTGSVASVFNGSFRYLWAFYMEKSSFKTSYMTLLFLQMSLFCTLYYVASVKILFLCWVSLIMCCEGGHFSLFVAIHGVMYGKDLGAKIYGIFFFSFGSSALLSYIVQLYLVNYQAMFWVLAGMTACSILNMWGLEPQKAVLLNSRAKESINISILNEVDS